MGYSKAPWKIEYSYGAKHLRSADGESLMCDEQYYPWVPGKDEDWNLMQAAPEMYEALVDILNAGHNTFYLAALTKARTALAKAKGKAQP